MIMMIMLTLMKRPSRMRREYRYSGAAPPVVPVLLPVAGTCDVRVGWNATAEAREGRRAISRASWCAGNLGVCRGGDTCGTALLLRLRLLRLRPAALEGRRAARARAMPWTSLSS